MKIYTKKGDTGFTSLIGGKRVFKTHKRIEAYGTIDELVSYIGLLRDLCNEIKVKKILLLVQQNLMICAAHAACEKEPKNFPVVSDKQITHLEKEIDAITKELNPQRHFILPGGHPIVSHCHIARCICRRAERALLASVSVKKTNKNIFIYINRLSDYLYVLARYISKNQKIKEICWICK